MSANYDPIEHVVLAASVQCCSSKGTIGAGPSSSGESPKIAC